MSPRANVQTLRSPSQGSMCSSTESTGCAAQHCCRHKLAVSGKVRVLWGCACLLMSLPCIYLFCACTQLVHVPLLPATPLVITGAFKQPPSIRKKSTVIFSVCYHRLSHSNHTCHCSSPCIFTPNDVHMLT